MNRLWRGVVGTILWSYERGSWPYDAMVIAILVFVLVTPRSWFHDQPQSYPLDDSGVQLLKLDEASKTRIYRVDAKLLAPQKRASKTTPELERETHDILSENVDDLKGRTFQVLQISFVRGANGAIQSYDVMVHP